MPYGLPNETPAITKKMESCVAGLVKQGKSKSSAIAICKSSIMKSKASEMMITQVYEFAQPGDSKTSEIQIMQTGEWKHPTYGKMRINESILDQMIQHFREGLRKGIYITEGHPQGDEELPAVGWVKDLVKKGSDNLWAVIEWTDKGMELLKSKAYKFFSPEFYFKYEDPETREKFDNVLTGGALTNKPYFKSLEAVVLSERFLTSKNTNMDLEKILAKDAKDITMAERDFLLEMKEDLDDETIKKYKLDEGETEEEKVTREAKEKEEADAKAKADEEAKKKAEDEAKAKDEENKTEDDAEKQFSEKFKAVEEQNKELEKKVNEMKMAERKREMTDKVSKYVFSEANKGGQILLKEKDKVIAFAETLDDEQAKKFFEILGKMPKANMFGEIGSGFKKEAKPAPKGFDEKSVELDEEAKRLMSENDKLSYTDAAVMAEQNLKEAE